MPVVILINNLPNEMAGDIPVSSSMEDAGCSSPITSHKSNTESDFGGPFLKKRSEIN